MKKIALIAVLAMAVPAFAWNGFQDTQDYTTPGYHGGGLGSNAAWSNNFGAWNEDYTGPRWGAEWMASNSGIFGVDGQYQFHGVYVGSSGDYNEVKVVFTAGAAITLQDQLVKLMVNRANGDYFRDLELRVDVNGGGFTTIGRSPTFGDAASDPAADYMIATADWKLADTVAGGIGVATLWTVDLSALGIQAGDVVTYSYRMRQNSPNGGNSKRIGLGVALPEPATMSLLALGGLALIRRRK